MRDQLSKIFLSLQWDTDISSKGIFMLPWNICIQTHTGRSPVFNTEHMLINTSDSFILLHQIHNIVIIALMLAATKVSVRAIVECSGGLSSIF